MMGDRVVVINQGQFQQVGMFEEVYDRFVNIFVVGFIGSLLMNFMDVIVIEDGFVDFGEFRLKFFLDQFEVFWEKNFVGREVIFGIRFEDIYDVFFVQVKILGENMVRVFVEIIENFGGEKIVYLSIGDVIFFGKFFVELRVQEGQEVDVVFDMRKVYVFEKGSGKVVF